MHPYIYIYTYTHDNGGRNVCTRYGMAYIFLAKWRAELVLDCLPTKTLQKPSQDNPSAAVRDSEVDLIGG